VNSDRINLRRRKQEGTPKCQINLKNRKASASYGTLWDSINGIGSWDADPWVVAYTFSVQHGNIDQIAKVAA
jgi:hypothetical protein